MPMVLRESAIVCRKTGLLDSSTPPPVGMGSRGSKVAKSKRCPKTNTFPTMSPPPPMSERPGIEPPSASAEWIEGYWEWDTGRNDFVRRYGDTGEDEFDSRGGTIPQRLVLMNGDIVREKIKSDFFTAPGRIAGIARDDRAAVETAYLTVLTRRPSPEEESHFMARLAGTTKDMRKERLTDLFWTFINTTEFSWNH